MVYSPGMRFTKETSSFIVTSPSVVMLLAPLTVAVVPISGILIV